MRRSQKEVALSRDIDELEEYKNSLTSECLKLERRKSQLAIDILNDIQEYRESGYEENLPIKKPTITGSNISDIIIAGAKELDFADLGFGKLGTGFKGTIIKALEKNKDKIDEKLGTVLAENGEAIIASITAQMSKRQVTTQ